MERTITLSGEPKSTQHIYRAACFGSHPRIYMTPEGKALKEQYQWEAKAQWRREPLVGDLALTVRFYFGSKRRFDLDNANKLWQDALSGIVFDDDSEICDLRLVRDYDKEHPRIQVTLAE